MNRTSGLIGSGDDLIILHPDQVPAVISWLQEAHEEASSGKGPEIVRDED